ncbi:MAG: LysM peptidoglycan-binding domain-containing protein [Caulobacteraceae bacterium]
MNASIFKRTFLLVLTFTISLLLILPAYADGGIFKKGDSSDKIAEIQAALKKLGYFNETCTGYFGEVTEKAVKDFQKAHKLDADGVLGPQTLNQINKLAGKNITIPGRASSSRKDTTKVNVKYKVRKGDTIWDIANDYNVSVNSILEANGLTEDSILDIGQTIIIPNVVKVVAPKPAETKPAEASKTETPTQDSAELGTIYEHNKNIYVAKEGDSFESIAEDFGVTAEAILEENKLSADAVPQIGQEIRIPEIAEDSGAAGSEESNSGSSALKGEYLDWFKEVQYIFENGDIATVTDVDTGKSFKVKRLYGRNHADSEPLTAEDTKIMKSIYGSWSWDRRAIVVTMTDKKTGNEINVAASMNGMPHGGQSIKNNNFNGQFCIHFKGSRTHSGNRLDSGHQAAVRKAAGL